MPFYNLSNEDDLLLFIQSEVQESLYLDYKSLALRARTRIEETVKQ